MIVDLQFRLQGDRIPADHGYALFAAISRLVPEVHGDETIGICPIPGRLLGDRSLALTRRSSLTVRLPVERIGSVLPLAGKSLQLGGHAVRIGVPQVRMLLPSPDLYSRLVVIKGYMEPEPFLEAAQRRLEALGVSGRPLLVDQRPIAEANANRTGGTRSPYLRRTLRIVDKEIVGFAVRVRGLTADGSLRLQQRGLGGRRRFGCGIFIPDGSPRA